MNRAEGRESSQSSLGVAHLTGAQRRALTRMTPAERAVFLAVEADDVGPREVARESGRSPGTVSNLLRRARSKVGGPS